MHCFVWPPICTPPVVTVSDLSFLLAPPSPPSPFLVAAPGVDTAGAAVPGWLDVWLEPHSVEPVEESDKPKLRALPEPEAETLWVRLPFQPARPIPVDDELRPEPTPDWPELPRLPFPVPTPAISLASEPPRPEQEAELGPELSPNAGLEPQPVDQAMQPEQTDRGELIWEAEVKLPESPIPADQDAASLGFPVESHLNEPVERLSRPRILNSRPAPSPKSEAEGPPEVAFEPRPKNPQLQPIEAVLEQTDSRQEAPQASVTRVHERPPSGAGEARPEAPPSAPAAASVEVPEIPRPARVATVRLEVPTGQEDSRPVRLTVRQRGEDLQIQVRAWDTRIGELTEAEMQPLLDSLAESRPIAESGRADLGSDAGQDSSPGSSPEGEAGRRHGQQSGNQGRRQQEPARPHVRNQVPEVRSFEDQLAQTHGEI